MWSFIAIGLLLAPPQISNEIAKLEVTVRDYPSNANAWKELGMAQAANRKAEPALAAFSKACDLNPKDEDACYFLGRQLFSLGRYREAVEPFEKAVLAAPKEKLARTHRAAALNRLGEGSLGQAERHFREAVRDNTGPAPVRADAQTDYGAFLFRQARIEEAQAALEKALKIHSGSARAHAELGRVLLHLDKSREAATLLERAIQLDSNSPRFRLLLGRAYLALGRIEEGERQLRLGREGWDRSEGSATVR